MLFDKYTIYDIKSSRAGNIFVSLPITLKVENKFKAKSDISNRVLMFEKEDKQYFVLKIEGFVYIISSNCYAHGSDYAHQTFSALNRILKTKVFIDAYKDTFSGRIKWNYNFGHEIEWKGNNSFVFKGSNDLYKL